VGERQPQVTLERGVVFNAALRSVLEPRGWIEVRERVRALYPSRKFKEGDVNGLHGNKGFD